MNAPRCLVDASIYIFRAYFALPDHWFSPQGYATAAVYGYGRFLVQLLAEARPSHIAACYDESLGSCFRNQLYPGYKASRALPDEALAFQLRACRELSDLLGIAGFASATHEADDLIGSLARVLRRSPGALAIVTRDKDLGQLLMRPQDYLWDPLAALRTHAPDLEARLGLRPEQLPDYLALVGDPVDDIPGVPGVGAKTAVALLRAFGHLEALFAQLPQVPALPIRGARTLPAKLSSHREQVFLARRLATIEQGLALGVKLADLRWRAPDWPALEDFAGRMGFPASFARTTRQMLAPNTEP